VKFLQIDTLQDALEAAFAVPLLSRPASHVVMFDEVGYLAETAREFLSILLRFFGPSSERTGNTPMMICGSVMAQLTKPFSAGTPLRGWRCCGRVGARCNSTSW
jgi:hypothetical protein